MPNTTGTSVLGLQLLNVVNPSTARFLRVLMPNLPDSRLTRVGTVLVTLPQQQGKYPVAFVYKLFGDGMTARYDTNAPPGTMEVWVRWFQAGIPWDCQTP